MKSELEVADRVNVTGMPETGLITRIADGYAVVEYDHGHCQTLGYYPLGHLQRIAPAPPAPPEPPKPNSKPGAERLTTDY